MINETCKIGYNYRIAKFKENEILKRFYAEHGGVGSEREIIEYVNGLIRAKSSLVRVSYYHNLVPNVFLYELAKRVGNVYTAYTLNTNKIVLGTDGTAAAAADTALKNEIIRSDFSLQSQTNAVSYLDKYFSASDVSGYTLLEAGVMSDAVDAIGGAGLLASRVVINESVSADESLTFNITFTFSNA